MSSLGRRASDSTPPTPASVLTVVREWAPVVIAALAWTGTQINSAGSRLTAVEHEQTADRLRDSASIMDRVAIVQVLTAQGRSDCIDNERRAIERGVPCPTLLAGNQWPLLHAPRAVASSTAMQAPTVPPFGSLPVAAIATGLIPVVPTPLSRTRRIPPDHPTVSAQ